jgi:hypothetical protein
MAGMGMSGLGQDYGAQSLATTLHQTRAARTAATLQQEERAADVRAREALASSPHTATVLALPKIEVPQVQPISKNMVYAALGVFALLGVLAFWPTRSS